MRFHYHTCAGNEILEAYTDRYVKKERKSEGERERETEDVYMNII